MNIVFIDDDPEEVELFCEIVHDIVPTANCQIIYTCTELENELKQSETPDVIFLDGHMQPISGLEYLVKLNEIVDRSLTKIVVHTGSISKHEEQEFIKLGVDAVLYKGSSYNEIKERLESAIVESRVSTEKNNSSKFKYQ